jgi:hypothetical protein
MNDVNTLRWIRPSSFEAEWGVAHRRVFSGADVLDQPFVNRAWSRAWLAGGLNLRSPELTALEALAQSAGDTTLVAVDAEGQFPDDDFAAVASWSREAFIDLHSSWLGHTTVHVFGHSASWGYLATHEALSLIAAPAEALSRFVTQAGGREYLRARFLEGASHQLSASLIDRALESVGWKGG